MTRLFFTLVALGTFLISMPGVSQDNATNHETQQPATSPKAAVDPVDVARHPCAGKTCSGHGRCVVTSGHPICMCDAGYRTPPTTRLVCIPSAKTQPTAGSQAVDLASRQRQLKLRAAEYFEAIEHPEYQDAIRRRRIGSWWIVTGSALFVTGVGLFLGGAVYVLNHLDDSTAGPNQALVIGLAAGSLTAAVFGVIFLVRGSLKKVRAGREIERYGRRLKGLAQAQPRIAPVLILHHEYQSVGLSVAF